MVNNDIPLCKNCVWYTPDPDPKIHRPSKPATCRRAFEKEWEKIKRKTVIDAVDGFETREEISTAVYCFHQRDGGKILSLIRGTCGRAGRFFLKVQCVAAAPNGWDENDPNSDYHDQGGYDDM